MKLKHIKNQSGIKRSLSSIHPLTETVYFVSVIIFSLTVRHPVYILLCLAGGAVCSAKMNGLKNLRGIVKFSFSALVLFAAVNPLFNHYGATRLFKLPDGNYVTLEAIVFGLISGFMFVSVILWFSCFNKALLSDKLMYLTGGFFPQLSLLFSMVLRLVPTLVRRAKTIKAARECIDINDYSKHNNRIKRYINEINKTSRILNVMIGWSLENSIEISDSMKARGYGLKNRTSYLSYKFDKAAVLSLIIIALFLMMIINGVIKGSAYFEVNPAIDINVPNLYDFFTLVLFSFYCFIPVLVFEKAQ